MDSNANAERLTELLTGLPARIEFHDSLTSTFDRAWEIADSAEFVVVAADEQTAGRGRLDRAWLTPAGSAVAVTVVLPAPDGPATLAAGVAAIEALAAFGIAARLKWPNDILLDGRKVGGILAQLRSGRLAIGIGINVQVAELPTATATSLHLHGHQPDRVELTAALVRGLTAIFSTEYLPRYRELCSTLHSQVVCDLPSGEQIIGTAVAVSDEGELVVDTNLGLRTFAVGDVVHAQQLSEQ